MQVNPMAIQGQKIISIKEKTKLLNELYFMQNMLKEQEQHSYSGLVNTNAPQTPPLIKCTSNGRESVETAHLLQVQNSTEFKDPTATTYRLLTRA